MRLDRFDRRAFFRGCSLSTVGLLVSQALAADEPEARGPARALVVIWLDGGPSQLETFDPHPGGAIGGPTRAIETSVPGIKLAEHLPRLAEQMADVALVRSMVSKEGDHQRGRYMLSTGYRPTPAIVHPALGSICAAELSVDGAEIPRYVQLLGEDRRAGGGFLGDAFDPLSLGDPREPPRNLSSPVERDRRDRRRRALDVVEQSLARHAPAASAASHREQVRQATSLMDSSQLRALAIEEEPLATRLAYGDTPFGRGLLAARRLVENRVRCVEVHLRGWDSHANNFEVHKRLAAELDRGFAALVADLRARDMLRQTLVLCTGEFGRTPRINGLDGRDHWPTGFSLALAGGGLRGGQAIGQTDPAGSGKPVDPVSVEDLFATVLAALGIDPAKEHQTSAGRPIKLSEGQPIARLLG